MGHRLILTEEEKRNIQKMYGMINEQPDDQLKMLQNEGYIDVTDSVHKGEYVLEIPDGKNYKVKGGGYQFKLLTDDNKETGYLFLSENGVRTPSMEKGPFYVEDNGKMIRLNQEFIGILGQNGRILYNQKLNQVKIER